MARAFDGTADRIDFGGSAIAVAIPLSLRRYITPEEVESLYQDWKENQKPKESDSDGA